MKLFISLILIVTFSIGILSAQPMTEWIKTYNLGGRERINDIVMTADGNIMILGNTSREGWMLKMTLDGDTLWHKNLNSVFMVIGSLVENNNGEFTCAVSSTRNYINIILTDSQGNILINNELTPPCYYCSFLFLKNINIQHRENGGYAVFGDEHDWVIEAGYDFNTLFSWNIMFDSTLTIDTSLTNPFRRYDNLARIKSVLPLSNDRYRVFGRDKYATSNSSGTHWNAEGLMTAIVESSGRIRDLKQLNERKEDSPNKASISFDGGYIVAGTKNDTYTTSDAWLFKTFEDGSKDWNKIYRFYGQNKGLSAASTLDSGYVISGSSSGRGTVVKTDNRGNILWRGIYQLDNQTTFQRVWQLDDGSYMLLGTIATDTTEYDILAMKLMPELDIFSWTDKKFVSPYDDSLIIFALSPPDSFILFGEIRSEQNKLIDSLELYDDGAHNDGEADDGLYANQLHPPPIINHFYFAGVKVVSNSTGRVDHYVADNITTLGPISIGSVIHRGISQNNENIYDFEFALQNDDPGRDIVSIKYELSTEDLCVMRLGYERNIDLIEKNSLSDYKRGTIYLHENCVVDSSIDIQIDILKDFNVFWEDSFSIDLTLVSVEDESENFMTSYSLTQNYPNPFNPVTKIEYSLPQSEDVSLIVYNLLGGEVARLIDERKQSGNYSVKWDASNLSSGIYFYRLQAGDFVQTRKMILLK